ncbi:MAG TPA: c-type cytochrome, partial [Aquifex aeolicus]|nr:c-type cytochrome [Aquifex aeolicus]
MKKLILAGLLVAGVSLAADGKAIFQSKGCASCHQPAVDTVGPSLKKIAQA